MMTSMFWADQFPYLRILYAYGILQPAAAAELMQENMYIPGPTLALEGLKCQSYCSVEVGNVKKIFSSLRFLTFENYLQKWKLPWHKG